MSVNSYRYITTLDTTSEESSLPQIWTVGKINDIKGVEMEIKRDMTAKEMADIFSRELIKVVKKDFNEKLQSTT